MSEAESILIPLHGQDGTVREHAIVDAADADWLNQWRWSWSHGYAVRGTFRGGVQRSIRMHRALLAEQLQGGSFVVDHMNRNRLDNRRANLRVVPSSANSQNTVGRPDLTSRYRGVHFDRATGRWRAEVRTGGRRFRIGRFDSEAEAAEAARAVRLRVMPYAVD